MTKALQNILYYEFTSQFVLLGFQALHHFFFSSLSFPDSCNLRTEPLMAVLYGESASEKINPYLLINY